MDAYISKLKALKLDIKYSYDDNDKSSIESFFGQMNFTVPNEYLRFIKEVGAVYIESSVMVKSKTNVPEVSTEDNYISVGRFLDWSLEGDYSIRKIMSMYSDQLPDNFIPFAEGCSGDFYGFSIKRDNSYFISYWYHESILNQQIYMVADDFKSFIMAINEYEIPDINTSNESSKDNHITPPKMVELLKKTGKWKGD